MARQRSTDLLERRSNTFHLECPRCHSHNIVSRGEGRYVCLNCRWERNLDNDWGFGPPPFFVIMAIGIFLMVVFLGG